MYVMSPSSAFSDQLIENETIQSAPIVRVALEPQDPCTLEISRFLCCQPLTCLSRLYS